MRLAKDCDKFVIFGEFAVNGYIVKSKNLRADNDNSPPRILVENREFKKLRRQLQRKRDIKIELCANLSLLRLFHFGHVVQNRRSALSLA